MPTSASNCILLISNFYWSHKLLFWFGWRTSSMKCRCSLNKKSSLPHLTKVTTFITVIVPVGPWIGFYNFKALQIGIANCKIKNNVPKHVLSIFYYFFCTPHWSKFSGLFNEAECRASCCYSQYFFQSFPTTYIPYDTHHWRCLRKK